MNSAPRRYFKLSHFCGWKKFLDSPRWNGALSLFAALDIYSEDMADAVLMCLTEFADSISLIHPDVSGTDVSVVHQALKEKLEKLNPLLPHATNDYSPSNHHATHSNSSTA